MCDFIKAKLFFIIIFFYSNNLLSQSTDSLETTLKEIVITGQINNTDKDDAVHKVKVIGALLLEKNVFQTVADVVNFETNINLMQDNILGSSINIQGISGQNVKILIDDVPVIGRLNGSIDLSQVLLNNIDQIEIIEGPVSVSYGTDALAGTINIITKKEYDNKINFGLSNYYESVGKYNHSFNLGYKLDKHQYSLEFGRNFFDGWSENDPYTLLPQSNIADTNRYKTWNPKEKIFGSLQHIFSKKEINIRTYFSDFYEKVTNKGLPRLPYYETAFDDYYYTYRKNIGTEIKLPYNQFNVKLLLTNNNFKRIKNTYFKDLTTLDEILVSESSANDTSSYNMIMSKVILTPREKKSNVDYQLGFHYHNQTAKGKRILNNNEVQNDYAVFYNLEYNADNLLIRPGVRFIYNDKFKAPIIPSINTLYKFRDFKYRFSYARGFRSPTLKELFFEFNDINHDIVGNTDLLPESSNNYQINISLKKNLSLNQLDFDFSTFYNNIINKIDLVASLDNVNQYTFYNINQLQTKGFSSNIKLSNKKIVINASFSRVGKRDFEHHIQYDYKTNYGSSIIFMINDDISVNTFYRFSGTEKRYFLEDNNLTIFNTDSYNLLDCSFNTQMFNKKIMFNFGVKNVFDVKEISSINSSNEVHSNNNNIANISYGRSYFSGLKINL